MNKNCKRCKSDIPILDWNDELKIEVYGLLNREMKLFLVKKLMNEHSIPHKEAKIIAAHLNHKFGNCIRCNNTKLDKENIECPKCKAFNYNLRPPVFNSDFCEYLQNLTELRNIDCEMIDHIPNKIDFLTLKSIQKERRIETQLYIGAGYEEEYKLIIHLGEKSINNYTKGFKLHNCIPTNHNTNWLKMNKTQNTIEINLL